MYVQIWTIISTGVGKIFNEKFFSTNKFCTLSAAQIFWWLFVNSDHDDEHKGDNGPSRQPARWDHAPPSTSSLEAKCPTIPDPSPRRGVVLAHRLRLFQGHILFLGSCHVPFV